MTLVIDTSCILPDADIIEASEFCNDLIELAFGAKDWRDVWETRCRNLLLSLITELLFPRPV